MMFLLRMEVNRVSIINHEINVLPNTGGSGIIPYIVVGLVLIITGVVCSIFMIRREVPRHEKSRK